MSLQMLLEGPDLDGILREVEANYGREFRVIQAEPVSYTHLRARHHRWN